MDDGAGRSGGLAGAGRGDGGQGAPVGGGRCGRGRGRGGDGGRGRGGAGEQEYGDREGQGQRERGDWYPAFVSHRKALLGKWLRVTSCKLKVATSPGSREARNYGQIFALVGWAQALLSPVCCWAALWIDQGVAGERVSLRWIRLVGRGPVTLARVCHKIVKTSNAGRW